MPSNTPIALDIDKDTPEGVLFRGGHVEVSMVLRMPWRKRTLDACECKE